MSGAKASSKVTTKLPVTSNSINRIVSHSSAPQAAVHFPLFSALKKIAHPQTDIRTA